MTIYSASSIAETVAVSSPAPGLFGTRAIGLGERTGRTDGGSLSNGTHTKLMSRIVYYTSATTPTFRLVYHNARGTGPYTIKASVDNGTDDPVPVFFAGQRTLTLPVGAWAMSDPVPMWTAKGSPSAVRTYLTVSSGVVWEFNHTTWDTSHIGGDACDFGTTTADATDSGTVPANFGSSYGPVFVAYDPGGRVPAIVGYGDSIMNGGSTTSGETMSWLPRACKGVLSCLIGAKGGETAASVLASAPSSPTNRFILWGVGNHRLSQYGVNDIYVDGVTLATMQTRWLALWNALAVVGGDAKVWQVTITPRTTADNATPSTGYLVRGTSNAWLRAGAPVDPTTKTAVAIGTSGALLCNVYGPTGTLTQAASGTGHPLSGGVIDIAGTVESGNLWASVSYTADGLHFTDAGFDQAATAITAAINAGAFA